MNLLVKHYFILFGFLLSVITPFQTVMAEKVSKWEDWYVTTENIVSDIVFPAIDKRVIKEYGGKESSGFGWHWERIVGINYNSNHSYDVAVRIQVPSDNKPFGYAKDLVKVRVYPSCDSPKMGCKHDFKVEILDYKHLSQ
ncbi:hypothetical protein AB1283_11980 [Bacillus sp. S13(2024)]|uniref:hypothetical protein n=1 Tax=unclassified Bacillus (in: firmicutes) TaxID=185979 RepID=UPI003D1AF6BA